MQAETQIQTPQDAPASPEIAPPGESKESAAKSNRGGKRPGAGRPPNLAKRLLKGFSREAIAEAIKDVDVGAVIVSLLKSRRERSRLEALVFLRDTLYGRPAQNVNLSGAMLHAHGIWRPLAELSDDEVKLLDSITKKLSAPAVSDTSPDASQNQIESNRAHAALTPEGIPEPGEIDLR